MHSFKSAKCVPSKPNSDRNENYIKKCVTLECRNKQEVEKTAINLQAIDSDMFFLAKQDIPILIFTEETTYPFIHRSQCDKCWLVTCDRSVAFFGYCENLPPRYN